MSPALKAYFAEYAAFHGTPKNRACHYVGIPLIVLSLYAFLARVPLGAAGGFTLSLAEVGLLGAFAYYLTLDPILGLEMLAVFVLLDAAGRLISWPLALSLFIVGWVLQFIGHYVYEKRSPAFLRNLTHLLVGPLWILAKATRRA